MVLLVVLVPNSWREADRAAPEAPCDLTVSAGRVMVNAPLVKGMKPTLNPKAPSSLIMLLIRHAPAGPSLHPALAAHPGCLGREATGSAVVCGQWLAY